MAKRRRRATYVRTLVYADEPHLIALDSGKVKAVAVSIPDETRDFPFLATVVSPRDWDRYNRGLVDLRYLFVYSRKESLFTFDLAKLEPDNKIFMEPITTDVLDAWLPDAQFFSRDHTEPEDEPRHATGLQKIFIDGEWGLSDFAHFYGKVTDVYSFEIAIEKYANQLVPRPAKAKVEKAFRNYPFRGGSSYGHFYKDLYGVLTFSEEPGIKSVVYSSPGYVEIKGQQDVFDRINEGIRNFQANLPEIKKSYRLLHTHLQKLGYLRASPREFDNSTSTAHAIMKEAEDLAALLKMKRLDLVSELCGGNALVVAKVVLSYSRRVEGAFDFFAEGRARFSE